MKKQETVWVRNNGTEAFSSRYDGEDFTIEPGQAVEMLVDCATLCLGFGEDDKTRCLRRLGWAFMGNDVKKATQRLEAFSFHMRETEALAHRAHDSNSKARSAAPAGGGEPSAAATSVAVVEEPPSGREAPLKPVLGKLADTARPAAG